MSKVTQIRSVTPSSGKLKMKNIITMIDLDSGLASIDSLLSGSPSFSSNPSLSYHTLPLDEPLDPPLTPPQQQRPNQKNKQMIPCVEERFWIIDTKLLRIYNFQKQFQVNTCKSGNVSSRLFAGFRAGKLSLDATVCGCPSSIPSLLSICTWSRWKINY